MKVIILSYLIFLSFYIIESATRSSFKINPNIGLIATTTTTTLKINHNNNNNNKNNNNNSSSSKTVLQKQKNINIQQIKSRQYFQTQPTTTIAAIPQIKREPKNIAILKTESKIKTPTTTSRYNNQRIELPTYPNNIVKNSLFNNENEIDYNNNSNQADNDANHNDKLIYGMKTTTKIYKNFENSAKDIDKSKKRQTTKQRKAKPDLPTKSPFLSSDDTNNVPKKYIPTTTNKPRTTTALKKNVSNSPIKFQLDQNQSLSKSFLSNDSLICPKETEAHFNLFAPNCKSHSDCTSWNKEFRCCTIFNSRNCHKGVPRPLEESSHSPILGIIPRKCPERPLAELFWDLKTCDTDDDCWPRVCCPDGKNRYCRTSTPEYESVPFQIGRPLAYVSEYLECTPPPPPIFDLHPKSCNSTLDCFPNVCCQEAGKKNCRPTKKSVLSFMANFFNTGLVRRLTNNLVIKK
ncbi:probable myosin light chain kinase DDB_G0279831 [Condylostylus longicornis]|uniref:probable myosin light chain kinase DDB_G0279831 n=1 Tax=Condylostylus longicornis TaxID=2530218 RepID=UPI00244DB269|nr:probable myosin light chain kinase DDB_G0279831 [Condylostylus longicornis]XP_055381292.1 probable myosin light chain kinase DDB_G0279831 [Condylostylus longicornis]XP_055381293.1 probable myosin light chain kinase DDB_G0279831 [Condylostylus longicornis]XP_055381294.1 probable myosin light chain kinase DDB_G0279831 [Condylostylus longicornis]